MITLIRHAASTYNTYNKSIRDPPLSELGKIQAKYLNGNYDLVICSTLKRARQTLDESNIIYKKIKFTELCREFRNGYPTCIYNGESEVNMNESKEEFEIRVIKFKTMLNKKKQKYNNIVVISHCIFLKEFCGKYLENCEIFNLNKIE